MPGRTGGEALATALLAVTLVVALVVRDDFTPPPTPPPPQFVVDVTGASVGSEANESGVFWTIDGSSASITVTNTTDEADSAVVRFRLVDGPCSRGQSIEFDGAPDVETLRIPPGGSTDVVLEGLTIGPFGEAVVEMTPTTPACPPLTTDPRSIAFQIFAVDATA